MAPQVMIQVRCSDGHEVLMWPKDCVVKYWIADDEQEVVVEWECPRCAGKLSKVKNLVEL